MELSVIDYKAYQHAFEDSDEFINYLKEEDGGELIKHYSLKMEYAWKLAEKIMEKYDFKLIRLQRNGTFQCIISTMVHDPKMEWNEHKEGYAESELPAMAICLAILDFFETKDPYIEEANEVIYKFNQQRKERKEKLDALIRKDQNK